MMFKLFFIKINQYKLKLKIKIFEFLKNGNINAILDKYKALIVYFG